jgi:hypothetical protein
MRTVLVASCALLLGAGAAERVEITPANVRTFYRDFDRLTRRPMAVDATISELCVAPDPASGPRNGPAQERERYGPHQDSYVHLYVRGVERAVFARARRRFPVGTIVVKEKLAPGLPAGAGGAAELVPNGVGGMQKMPRGYDAEGGDWLYFYSSPSGELTSGRLESCRSCHLRALESDFVFYVE